MLKKLTFLLDRACAGVDIAIECIRNIIVKIPSIVAKLFQKYYGRYV